MKVKKCLILLFALIGVIIISGSTVLVAGTTTVIKKTDGTDLTYRNSSEKVLRLEEYTYPTQDFRAVWISNFVGDIASYANETQYKTEVNTILDNMEAYGINAMIFHIRIHNDALYDSDLNPLKNYWKDVNFDQFDPLTYIIEESHKRGIEFHAWLNPYRVISTGLTTDLETFATNYRNTNPAFPDNPAGNANLLLKSGASGVILNPGEPVVRNHIYDTIDEIVTRYDVDAIHFDDYFYNNVNDLEDNYTYNKAGYNPKGLGKADWRRDQVNILMEGIDTLLDNHFAQTGKVVQLGISPTGIYRNAASGTAGQEHYAALYCDSVAWIRNEWIDYLLPQTYWGLEHPVAGFAQLTRYWSSVAEGYDVNIYMGHGIYMSPNSGWANNDEVRNRFLNMEMYERIDGSCFYKYSFFKNVPLAIEQVKRGLTLVKNDYWAKKIPGSVVRSYENLVPIHDIPNIYIDKVSDTKLKLSWDAVEDVRGYVVYRTLKNEQLDVKNMNHLYKYLQANEIEITDDSNYEYYVSTVNNANVISTPKNVGTVIVGDVEGITKAIDQITLPVQLSQEEFIITIRGLYEQLTSTEKAEITNIDKLVQAEAQILNVKVLRTSLQQVINRASKHVTTDYFFPVAQDETSQGLVTWKFKSASDVHDLTTGKRLKEILSYHPVTLVATITKDGLTYSEDVVVNFGITKGSETPIFYRNSASAMTKDEPGEFNTTSHIGWDGKTLTVGNFVFFIAKGNYLPLTSNTLPTTFWHSCATLYHNVSENDISFALGDSAIRTDVNTYGYLIIDEGGLVRVSSTNNNPSSIITLRPNELLLATQYLDSQLSNPIFVPATNIAVGTPITFTDYEALRNDAVYQAGIVIDLINALPEASTITVDTDLIMFFAARDAYDLLSVKAKALVTNLSKLEEAEVKIESLKSQLVQIKKEEALGELMVYEDNLHLYTPANQEAIENILIIAQAAIENATTIEQVETILTNYITLLEDVMTIEEENQLLNAQKQVAKQELQQYLDLTRYSEENQLEIEAILSSATAAINQVQSKVAIDEEVVKAKALLDEVMSFWDKAKNDIELYVNPDHYNDIDKRYIETITVGAFEDIDAAETVAELDEIVDTFKGRVDYLIPLYVKARKDAKKELDDYVKLSDYSTTNSEKIQDLIAEAKAEIDMATDQLAIDEIVSNAQAEIDKISKEKTGTSCQFAANYFYYFIGLLGVFFLIRRKK